MSDRPRHSVTQPGARSSLGPGTQRLARIAVNLAGAVIAALFAQASLRFYLHTHRLIGGLFVIEQTCFAVMFLLRRPAEAVSRRPRSWLLAFGGTFGALLLRPGGTHPPWGVQTGFIFQLTGLLIAIASLLALGRSFGFVAADQAVGVEVEPQAGLGEQGGDDGPGEVNRDPGEPLGARARRGSGTPVPYLRPVIGAVTG